MSNTTKNASAAVVSVLVYIVLELLPKISIVYILIDLFIDNHELKRYLKEKILPCF